MSPLQVNVGGILLHRPPHRQFLIQRCSHCFMAFVLLGERSIVTQPHLKEAELSDVIMKVEHVTSLPTDSPGAGFALLSGTDAHVNTTQVIHPLRARSPASTHRNTQVTVSTVTGTFSTQPGFVCFPLESSTK